MSDPGSFWDARFAAEHYVYGTAPNDFLAAEAARIPAGGAVLSLGEGEGRNATFLAGRGHAVTCVDASIEGLRKTERLAAARGVRLTLVHADLADYAPAPGAFAGVISIYCHLPPAVRRLALARAAAALAPGGVLLLEAYTPRQLRHGTGGPRDEALLVEPAALREELGGLELAVLRELERDVHEGVFHHGRSAVVQAVAVKPAGG